MIVGIVVKVVVDFDTTIVDWSMTADFRTIVVDSSIVVTDFGMTIFDLSIVVVMILDFIF